MSFEIILNARLNELKAEFSKEEIEGQVMIEKFVLVGLHLLLPQPIGKMCMAIGAALAAPEHNQVLWKEIHRSWASEQCEEGTLFDALLEVCQITSRSRQMTAVREIFDELRAGVVLLDK